jgi:predicted transcriptional regulator of viral defense system
LAQLNRLGLTARAAQKRVLAGALHRIYRGVYSIAPPALLTAKGRYMAAVLACGPGAVLSHRSAAALHGLRRTDRAGIDVTVPGRRRVGIDGIDVHNSLTLTDDDTTVVDNIPCTSVARTVFDLANVVPRRQVERALDQAEAEQLLDLRKLEATLERNRHTRAYRVLKAILADYRIGPSTESELEEVMLAACRAANTPLPDRQVYIDRGDGEPAVRADFVWREQRLIVETDGDRFHRTRRAFEADRRRDQRLLLAGA